jgi:hypothetical protein
MEKDSELDPDRDGIIQDYCQLWSKQADGLPASLIEKASVELNEDTDTRISALRNLRSLITTNSSDGKGKLVYERFGEAADLLLLQFLRARKFNTKQTFDLMKGQFTNFVFFTVQLL